METVKLIAKTFQGLEEVLAKELVALGAQAVEPGRRMVSFEGDKAMFYKANFCLRTAVRILKPIAEFRATTADEVYDKVKAIRWEDYLDVNTTFAIDSVVYSEDFRHSKFVSYKVKDAIVDYFREREGKRPSISVTNPNIRFNMHIAEDQCTLSLDSSGESLHKRGYREATVDSPINEVLAAAMILMTGWQADSDFIDPMCGSGTIAIEAALIARNIAPGVFRKNFAFEQWRDFDRELFEEIYNDDSQEREFAHKIYAYDVDRAAIAATNLNAKSAGVLDIMHIEARPIQEFTQPENPAIMVMNPPYGERITTPNLLALYRTIGEKLKHQFVGGEAWMIGYRRETFDQVGLKPSLTIPLYNGSLDCEFRKYQIFNGRLADFRAEGHIIKTDEDRERNAAKRRLKPRREAVEGDGTPASSYEREEDPIPAYVRERHREFMRSHRELFKVGDDDDRPVRERRERKPFNKSCKFAGRSAANRGGRPFGGKPGGHKIEGGNYPGKPYKKNRGNE